MLKLNILNMKNFLKAVNACRGEVSMLCPDGSQVDINGNQPVQDRLSELFLKNKKSLRLDLKITNPKDYLNIVSYYAGDC